MVDRTLEEQFIGLRADGMSYAAIGKKLGIAKGTVIKWGRELGHDVSALSEVRMEALKTKYKLTQTQQVERYGKWLKQIEGELSRRNFKDMRTDHLMLLAMKLTAELRLYVPPPQEHDGNTNALTVDDLEAMSRGEYIVTED